MKTRILSGIIMLPLLAFVFVGGKLLLAGCFLLSILALREFYNGFSGLSITPSVPIGMAMAFLLYTGNLLGMSQETHWVLFWFFLSVLLSLLYLFKIEERKPEDMLATIGGLFYVVFFSYHIILTEQTGEYRLLVWLIFLTAFGTDIFAYFTGVFLGKHKLCPTISPKKTIEGSVGGILGSMALSGVFGYFVVPELLIHCLVIAFLGGIISQLGDLIASIFKRKMGLKDYGNLIPGHGGVLDRIDSVLFTAPLVYYYIEFIIR